MHKKKHTKLRIFYKKGYDKGKGYKAGGLAANAAHTVTVLGNLGYDVERVAVTSPDEVTQYLRAHAHVTHVVLEAIWVTAEQLSNLAAEFGSTIFVVRAHSKMGFLQVEPEALPEIRKIIDTPGVYFSSNNLEFADALSEVYGSCLYLPNLYSLPPFTPDPFFYGCGTLRIASFGASRLLKLHPNAALAALRIAKRLNQELDFYVNIDSTPGGESVRRTIDNMFAGLSWARVIRVPWQDQASFRDLIAEMDLVIQLSATETFCMVAADAVATGVPVVGGPAISWLPSKFQVGIDDSDAAATLGTAILSKRSAYRKAAFAEYNELIKFISSATDVWTSFLTAR